MRELKRSRAFESEADLYWLNKYASNQAISFILEHRGEFTVRELNDLNTAIMRVVKAAENLEKSGNSDHLSYFIELLTHGKELENLSDKLRKNHGDFWYNYR